MVDKMKHTKSDKDSHMDYLEVAVVIPCYRVTNHVLDVIKKIGSEVTFIFAIDDCCPDGSGAFIKNNCTDSRVVILCNSQNLGVGGAVLTGYRAAVDAGADIIVKIDGDGQMDPSLISNFVTPIIMGDADYTKGNRFFDLDGIELMPKIRIFGNTFLSFITKLSSGYWSIFDPTNGYTAIHSRVVNYLPLEKISNRYFFETDMLFRLNTLRAVVMDIPMKAVYGEEKSNLKITNIFFEFLAKNFKNTVKRIFYNYFLRDMTVASFELIFGLGLLVFGLLFGSAHWIYASLNNIPTPLGTIMLAALPTLVGIQLLLAFIGFDTSNIPKNPIHKRLPNINK